jgi:hypothetical protein
MPTKKQAGLPPEVLAVLRSSSILEPCENFRRVSIDKFFARLKDDKCKACLAFLRQLELESNTIRLLARSKN